MEKILQRAFWFLTVASIIYLAGSSYSTLYAQQETTREVANTAPLLTKNIGLNQEPLTTLDLVNNYRVEQGLITLLVDPILSEMAQERADDMARNQYFAHKNPEGKIFYELMSEQGIAPEAACENLSLSYSDDIGASFRGWKSSPGHNSCMLDSRMTRSGYAVQVFGTSYDSYGNLRTHYLVVAIHGS